MTIPQQPATPSNAPAAGDPQQPTQPAQPTQPQGAAPQAGQPATGQQPPAQQQPTPQSGQQPGATPGDEPLGAAGLKALQDEREARKALEKQLNALKPLADLLGNNAPTGDGKSDLDKLTERIEAAEKAAAEERMARWRLEVAGEKGLTPQQAARLAGATREELAADADALLALFPQQAAGQQQQQQPGTPKPDPTQGSRGAGSDIDARIAEAEKNGKVSEAIALKAQKFAATQK